MRPRRLVTIAFGCLSLPISLTAASLVVDTTEPSTDVVIANPHTTFTTASPGPLGQRDTFTTVFSSGAGANVGARGQSFFMPANGLGLWDVSALTIRADVGSAQDLTVSGSASLTMWVFEWNPANDANASANWTLADGISDGDSFDGTGITTFLVNGVNFDITRTFNGEYLHFNTPGLQLSANKGYGALWALNYASTTGLRLDDVRDNVSPTGETLASGAILRSDAAANTMNNSGDDIVFYLQATAVPEPTTWGLLALGFMTLCAAHRKS